MAAPTLRAQRDELRQEVAYMLGYGRTAASWSSGQIADIDQAIKDGLRRFYSDYDWSFLRPVATLVTVANQSDYDLPDGFAYLVGDMAYTDANGGCPIRIVGEDEYGKLKMTGSSTGRPEVAVIGSTKAAQTTFRNWLIRFWPTPNAAYTLRYVMRLTPEALTASITDAPGHVEHAQTILAACKAAAELIRNNEPGVWREEYNRALQASIRLESWNRPHSYGMMTADDADGAGMPGRAVSPMRYNGSVVG